MVWAIAILTANDKPNDKHEFFLLCIRHRPVFSVGNFLTALSGIFPLVLRPTSNEAPGQIRRNPSGGSSLRPRQRCSLLTDPRGICTSLAPCLGRKLLAANLSGFTPLTTKPSGFRLAPSGW